MIEEDQKTELYKTGAAIQGGSATSDPSASLDELAAPEAVPEAPPELQSVVCPLEHPLYAKAEFVQPWFLKLFKNISHLGSGGLGLVFQAEHGKLDRPIALKIPTSDDPETVRNFDHEMRIASILSHDDTTDCTVKIFSTGEVTCILTDHEGRQILLKDIPYSEMELLEGKTLEDERQILHDRTATPTEKDFQNKVHRLLGVNISEVCRALCQAHRNSIAHSDITPSNILTQSKRTRIIDWGLAARIERDELETHLAEKIFPKSAIKNKSLGSYGRGRIAGTPAFMAPEVLNTDHPVDPRSDVYALGAVLYTLLTNEYCIDVKSQTEFINAIGRVEITPPHVRNPWVPQYLSDIVMKALEYDTAKRYQSMGEFERALLSYLSYVDGSRV